MSGERGQPGATQTQAHRTPQSPLPLLNVQAAASQVPSPLSPPFWEGWQQPRKAGQRKAWTWAEHPWPFCAAERRLQTLPPSRSDSSRHLLCVSAGWPPHGARTAAFERNLSEVTSSRSSARRGIVLGGWNHTSPVITYYPLIRTSRFAFCGFENKFKKC